MTNRQSESVTSKKDIKKVQRHQIPLMADDKKNFKIARSTFDKRKIDPSSAAFAEEILKKIKIS